MIRDAVGEIVGDERLPLEDHGLADLQEALRRSKVTCAALAGAFLQAIGSSDDDPAARALRAVAAAADRSGLANAFHNPAHTREVAVNWWLLARLHGAVSGPLARQMRLLGLIAAFGHDVGHDGGGSGNSPDGNAFRLETIAVGIVAREMRRARMTESDCAIVAAMILSTDVREGYAHLRESGPVDARFAPFADPLVLLSARMLRDADLLPSAGTSVAAYRARTAELEREEGRGGRAPSGDMAAYFFDHIVERRFLSPAGQRFASILHVIAASATGRSSP